MDFDHWLYISGIFSDQDQPEYSGPSTKRVKSFPCGQMDTILTDDILKSIF